MASYSPEYLSLRNLGIVGPVLSMWWTTKMERFWEGPLIVINKVTQVSLLWAPNTFWLFWWTRRVGKYLRMMARRWILLRCAFNRICLHTNSSISNMIMWGEFVPVDSELSLECCFVLTSWSFWSQTRVRGCLIRCERNILWPNAMITKGSISQPVGVGWIFFQ